MTAMNQLTDVLNNLIDLSAQGHNEDAAFVLAAVIEDIRSRDALDELEWVLTSLRDTNLDSTSCLVLATLVYTKSFPSKKRKAINDWYVRWLELNRDEATVRILTQVIGAQDEYHTAPSSAGTVFTDED